MRWILAFLLALGCSVAVAAQGRHATIELDGGRTLTGPVVRFDAREIVLDLDGRTETIPATQIRTCRFHEGPGGEPTATGEGAAVPTPTAGSARPAGTAVSGAAPQGGPPAAAATTTTTGRGNLAVRRLSILRQSYPWLLPQDTLKWVSIALGAFVLLALCIHSAARISGAEAVRFGRSLPLALFLAISVVVQMALLPEDDAILIGAAGANVLIWIGMFRLSYGVNTWGGMVGTVTLLIEGFVLFLVLELLDSTLRGIGGDWSVVN